MPRALRRIAASIAGPKQDATTGLNHMAVVSLLGYNRAFFES